ncbi:hypothetical protein C8J56DRAFT_886206 [Mycena floridula]|nr:hypothetical protein C8J56DRAFT_886206 [Mycena floridula]
MASVTRNIAPEYFCRGRANYAEFKERFTLAMQAQGLDKILTGDQMAPVDNPTQDTVEITHDSAGNVTGSITTSKAVLSTITERRANANLYTAVLNAKSHGLDPTKMAAENWKKLEERLGKGSMTEQIITRDKLLAIRFTPTHEPATEFDDYAQLFQNLVSEARASGGEYKDDVLRTTFIVSINNDDRSAQNHDLPHCWAPGGGDVANRPPGYKVPVVKQNTKANTTTVPNVVAQSVAVTPPTPFHNPSSENVSVPDVFVLHVNVPTDPPTLESRIDLSNGSTLLEHIHFESDEEMPALVDVSDDEDDLAPSISLADRLEFITRTHFDYPRGSVLVTHYQDDITRSRIVNSIWGIEQDHGMGTYVPFVRTTFFR